jgi:hypothetical protein
MGDPSFWGQPYFAEDGCPICGARAILSEMKYPNGERKLRYNCAECGVEASSADHVVWLLQRSLKIHRSNVGAATSHQGLYVLWLEARNPTCLKVGIAGERGGQGVRGRLKLHFSSHPDNSVLARHLAADTRSEWTTGTDFNRREDRQNFLRDTCYFQAVATPNLSRNELEHLEAEVIARLHPKYAGAVGPS